jgi:hypothetical protein
LCLLPAAVAHASFDNSHHDMRTYVPAGAVVSGCAPCHGYVTTSVSTAFDNDIGSVGGICLARCHIGDAIAGAVNPQLTPTTGPGITAGPSDYATVVSPNITITYFTLSHGRNPANLVNPSFSGPPGPITWPPTAASTWPYVVNTATRMECTSCHSVHDNRNGAFLWSPLAPISSATAADGFCDKCHQESGRRGDIASAPSGNHPVNVVVDNGAAAVRATNTRRGRRIVIQDYGLAGATSVFDVATAAPSTLIGPTAESTAWNSGGHVVSWGSESNQSETPITNWVPGTTTQVMGCYTCHAAHRTNRGGENNLVVLPTMNSGSSWNPVCVGCHGPSTTIAGDRNEWIVGALTRYGHPVGDNTAPAGGLYTTTVGNLYFAVTTPGVINLENGNGLQGGRVLCTSCHKVHGGTGMALANLGQAPGTGTGAICKRCHNGIGIPNLNDASKSNNTLSGHNAPNSHHVTRIGSMTLPGNILATAETDPIYIKQPGWSTSGGLGDISVSMDCPDCHVFNKTAHNW